MITPAEYSLRSEWVVWGVGEGVRVILCANFRKKKKEKKV